MHIDKLINTINKDWSEDSKIDILNLTEESIKTPIIHAKYLKYLTSTRLKLAHLRIDREDLKSLKYRYYRGELCKEELKENGWVQFQGPRPLKSAIYKMVDSDNDILKMSLDIENCESALLHLESIMSMIKSRDWQIKNIISWESIKMGN